MSLAGKITVFVSLALSKITHLALVKIIPPSIINRSIKQNKNFICKGLNPEIKNSTINNNYKNVGLNDWIKRSFDENFHDWKIIPLHIIRQSLGKKFVQYLILTFK